MKVGRKFRAKFADNDSKAAYMTYSAGQALVYNACAEEARYFDFFAYRYGETQQKDVRPVSERNEPARRWECFSMKRSLLGPPSLAIEVLRAAKIDLLSVQRKQLVSTLRF